MKNLKNNLWLIILVAIAAVAVFVMPVSASTTDGTIDSTYKYAWGENVGWINFGTANGNVHITDSGLSGYALSETAGWINLDNVVNDGEGNLSGYGWSENTGWIKFNPANGGVIINSSGEFTGSALSETVGWIIFGGDYKVTTDWRPQSARPCVSWTYSDWSSCSNSLQTRTIISSSPSGCSGGSPVLSQTCSSGGGGLPAAAYNPPAIPQAGFKVSINQGAEYTNSLTVSLSFVAGKDTARMAISESPDFKNAVQIPYQKELKWELLPNSIFNIQYSDLQTIYVKFYTAYGVASPVFSDSIILDTSIKPVPAPQLAPEIPEDTAQLSPEDTDDQKIPSVIKPAPTSPPDSSPDDEANPVPTPYFQTPPDKPEPINPDWNLIDSPEVKNFFPQQNEISFYTQKFSSIADTFSKLNISSINDISSRASSASFNLPNLLEILGLQLEDNNINAVSLANLQTRQKQKIPTEIVFISAYQEKINFNSSLVLDEGSLKQKISAPSSTNLNIAIKPDQPASSISGYIALKKSAYSLDEKLETGYYDIELKRLLSFRPERSEERASGAEESVNAKCLFLNKDNVKHTLYPLTDPSAPIVARDDKSKLVSHNDIQNSKFKILSFLDSIFSAKSSLAQETEPKEIEQRFVLAQFQYADPDQDGIWTADIQTPAVTGEYEIISLINYQDQSIPPKEIRLITVIDPEGYVYEKQGNKETRIPNATISLYYLKPQIPNSQLPTPNPQITNYDSYELWNAENFDQKNPQITDATGKYSFLVPAGSYYIKAEAAGYHPYQSDIFEVSEAKNVHLELELKAKLGWKNILTWERALLILLFGLIIYNFYRGRRKKYNLKVEKLKN